MKASSLLLTFFLFLAACGGRALSSNHARDIIIRIPREALPKEDVEVVNIRQVSGSEAVVETRLKTAFRLEKSRGQWVVREMRLGHGEWEKLSNLIQALEEVKIAETRTILDRVAEAIRKYRSVNGNLPAFEDYISLSDLLSPKFMTPVIRLDSWRQPLAAERVGPSSIVIRSAGPDGKHGTQDDISRSFPP